MALDRLTKIDGGGISTTSDYRVGVITATKFVGPIDGVVTGSLTGTATTAVNAQGLIGTPDITVRNIKATGLSTFVGDAQFDGNVSIAGTLTYEDVTNIDSVGLITARDGIDCNADIDVDGHTNLDNVSVAGVTTFTDDVYFDGATAGRDIVFDRSDNQLEFAPNAKAHFGGSYPLKIYNNINSYISQSYQAALFIEAKDLQIYGSGGGYNYPIFLARNGIIELGYQPSGGSGSVQLKTSAKGITVGTGVTIETNGQATFVGVVTFGSGSTTIDNNVVNVGTALTLGHTQGVQFHTQNLHSRGFEVNQINASGIITASSFRGPTGGTATFQDIDVDGHTNLDNVSVTGVTTISGTGEYLLQLSKSDSSAVYTQFINSTTGTSTSDGFRIGIDSNEDGLVWLRENGNLKFGTANDERLRIDSAGRLLLNTTTTYVSNQIMIVKGASPSGGGNRPYDGQLAIESTETSGAINTGGVLAFIGHDGNTSRGFGSIRNLKEDGTTGNFGTYMSFETRTNGSAPAEKLRIDSSGRVLIGSTAKAGDSALQVYTSDKLHPAIRTHSASNNGYTMFGDAYKAGESQVNIGISYSSASLVLSNGCKVNTSNDDAYVSSQGTYSTRPTVIRLDTDGSISFHNTASASTTPTDNAVTLTERLRINSSGQLIMTNAATQTFFDFSTTNNTTRGVISLAGKDGSGNAVTLKMGGFGDTSRGEIFTHSNHGLGFATNNAATQMMLDTSGRLYLGSNLTGGNADVDDLVISGTGNKGITVCSTSGGNVRITFADGLSGTAAVIGSIVYEHSVDAMDFYTNALRMMRVDRANSTERLQIGAINNNSAGTRLVVGPGNNFASTAIINTADTNINALTLSNWDGSTTTNKVNMHFDASGIAGFDVGIPAATTAFKIANTSGGGGYLNLKSTGETMIYRSGVIQADINNSVSGHKFVSQCDDNNNGFEIYQQHGSTSTRNTLAVYNNSTGSKHANFYVRGDNQVFISGNKDTTGLVMDGTSSGTYFGETGNTIDFRMNNEVNQFTGNPAARIASFLERGNNGFGLKFYARNSAGTFASMVQLSADYRWEPTLDATVDLGSSSNSWRKAYIQNMYPDHSTEQATSGSSFSSSSWYDVGFSRGSMGGLDLGGTYIITLFADTYAAGGGNYSCNYTWIVGMRNQSTNQNSGNSVPLLSVTGHSTNGVLFELRTKRNAAVHGGDETIQWKCSANLSQINNGSGRLMRWRAQRIGRTCDG